MVCLAGMYSETPKYSIRHGKDLQPDEFHHTWKNMFTTRGVVQERTEAKINRLYRKQYLRIEKKNEHGLYLLSTGT
jgi:hypothetical protein